MPKSRNLPNTDARQDPRADRTPHSALTRPAKPCACSGVRSCLRCLDPELRRAFKLDDPLELPPLLRTKPSPHEALLQEPVKTEHGTIHAFDPISQTAPTCPAFSGVRLYPEAISASQEQALLEEIEQRPFSLAQSGKAKQHFGAKINFNKRKMNTKGFRGLPASAKRIEEIARDCIDADATLNDECAHAVASFKTTDFFALRYFEEEGSNLDFHSDDRFGYGEAILDLSLESDSVLTFIRPRYPNTQGPFAQESGIAKSATYELPKAQEASKKPAAPRGPLDCVRVPLPARSIALLYGAARFDWEHAILAYDIRGVRTSITLRTLCEEIRKTEAGRNILALADIRL